VELINHNYTDFIDLSTILVGTDKLINNLKYPLINMRRDVEVIINMLKIYINLYHFNFKYSIILFCNLYN